MLPEDLKQNVTVYGPLFPEPVQIILAIPMGSSIKVIGKGGIQSCSNGFLATTGGGAHGSAVPHRIAGGESRFSISGAPSRAGTATSLDMPARGFNPGNVLWRRPRQSASAWVEPQVCMSRSQTNPEVCTGRPI